MSIQDRLLGVDIGSTTTKIALVGEDLHIAHLNLEEGKLTVEGRIAGIEYGDKPAQKKGGILSRWLR